MALRVVRRIGDGDPARSIDISLRLCQVVGLRALVQQILYPLVKRLGRMLFVKRSKWELASVSSSFTHERIYISFEGKKALNNCITEVHS